MANLSLLFLLWGVGCSAVYLALGGFLVGLVKISHESGPTKAGKVLSLASILTAVLTVVVVMTWNVASVYSFGNVAGFASILLYSSITAPVWTPAVAGILYWRQFPGRWFRANGTNNTAGS